MHVASYKRLECVWNGKPKLGSMFASCKRSSFREQN